MKISHRKGSTRVKIARDITVTIFATFKMCYKHFHSTKLPHFAYLIQMRRYKTIKGIHIYIYIKLYISKTH